MLFPVVLLLALRPIQASNAPVGDALALLIEVSQQYADAKSYHIEAVEERTSSNELQRSWEKTLLTAIVTSGRRYRYEGRSGFGAAVVVSDGVTEWIYHLNDHLYVRQPTPREYPPKGKIIPHEETPTMEAADLASEIAHRAHRLKSAVFLPDETISIDGKDAECYVIRYSERDFRTRENDLKQDTTLWIEKSRKVVLKSVSQTDAYVLTESHAHIPIHDETTVIYPVVELNQDEPASSFTFVAPADARLVPEFSNYFLRTSKRQPSELTGKPAPELRLKSPDGKTTELSSFRGKPVFIEFWTTWCGPCVDLMPELTKLYAETADKGLAWMSIDSDEDSGDAAKFIAEDHIPWPNYHDEDGSLGKAFQRQGIPLGVLIDSGGKITFYESGYEVSDLRAAVAKLGPQFSSVAPANGGAK
jgi:thiol-disulfide isomerase/thioredoxin/outer membrane lipoprotein-sorting protein